MSLDLPGPVLLLGAGKMGGAMMEGWLAIGVPPSQLLAIDPQAPEATRALMAERGVALNPAPAAIGRPAVVVLAVKPQMMEAALPSVAPYVGADTLVLSIMAGKTLEDLARPLPQAGAIVRAMPNTPASVGRGITVAIANARVSIRQKATADALLRATGLVEWVEEESLMDAVTALSGSGPAYVFHLVEAMAEAGVAAGLPAGLSMRLARATVEGAGELLHRSDLPAARLRENVTSPGGTTAAALAVLMAEDGLTALMKRAVAAAKRRGGELAG
jgi:pyrroline-5-carboxylate reductase